MGMFTGRRGGGAKYFFFGAEMPTKERYTGNEDEVTKPKRSKRCFPNGGFQIPCLAVQQRKTHFRGTNIA